MTIQQLVADTVAARLTGEPFDPRVWIFVQFSCNAANPNVGMAVTVREERAYQIAENNIRCHLRDTAGMQGEALESLVKEAVAVIKEKKRWKSRLGQWFMLDTRPLA